MTSYKHLKLTKREQTIVKPVRPLRSYDYGYLEAVFKQSSDQDLSLSIIPETIEIWDMKYREWCIVNDDKYIFVRICFHFHR